MDKLYHLKCDSTTCKMININKPAYNNFNKYIKYKFRKNKKDKKIKKPSEEYNFQNYKIIKKPYEYNNYQNVFDQQFDYDFLNPIDYDFDIKEGFINKYSKKYLVICILIGLLILIFYIYIKK